MADLLRNCKGFRTRESVHARVTESRVQGTDVGRDIRQSPSRVQSVFLLIYGPDILEPVPFLSRHGAPIADVAVTKRHQRLDKLLIYFYRTSTRNLAKLFSRKLWPAIRPRNLTQLHVRRMHLL